MITYIIEKLITLQNSDRSMAVNIFLHNLQIILEYLPLLIQWLML